ncbi:hypothetical protein D3C78_1234140 [compost metagenome]
MILAKTGEIKGVRTACIPGAEHDFILRVGGGEKITIGIGIKAVNRVAAAGRHIGAIELLDRRNVI